MSQAGLIDIEGSHPQIPTQFNADTGSAIPISNILNIFGGDGINTSASGMTVTIAIDSDTVGQTLTSDSGGALSPVAGNWNILGGSNVTVSGAGNTLTIDSTGGGDVFGPASSTDNAIVRWNGTTGKLIQNSNVTITDSGETLSIDGVSANPSYSFSNDSNTGIYRTGADAIGFSANGTLQFGVESGILRLYQNARSGTANGRAYIQADDGVTRPAYAFAGDIDSGMRWSSSNNIHLMTTGVNALSVSPAQIVTLAVPLGEGSGGTGESTYTNGQLLIGNSSDNGLDKATITAGTGVSIVNGNGTITVNATGGGFSWIEVTGTSDNLAANTGYIANNAGLVTLTLPGTCSLGDTFRVVGKGAGGWRVAQNASQTIHFASSDTTTGTAGRLDSTGQYDCVELLCTATDTDFTVISSAGVIGVT